MKRVFLILIALIGIGLIGLGFTTPTENSSSTVDSIESDSGDCYCPRCEVKLNKRQKEEVKWFDCFNCSGTGKVNCAVDEWKECRYCRGTGCKDGYTTNNGKNCTYGHCSYCNGKGGKNDRVMRKVCDCNVSNCKYNSSTGRYGQYKGGSYYWVYECPKCSREYSGC